MDDFAGSADQIAEKLVQGGMDPERAMMLALRMAQSRQQANESILGGVPTQPPTSDVPPATEILGGDPSRLFQRQPTTMERIRDLPKDVLGAGEALVSMGSLAALAPASMMYALRPGQKTQGDPMEFALRNMYMPRSERGPSHLAGLGEVLESLPQTGPLPELQAFTGVGRGVGRQLTQKARQAGEAMAPAAANVAEDILRRQGLLMDLTVHHGSPHKFAPTERNPLGEFNPEKIGTGEGNQTFGYGHYTAEAQGVAKDYKNKLSQTLNVSGDATDIEKRAAQMALTFGDNTSEGAIKWLSKHEGKGAGHTTPPLTPELVESVKQKFMQGVFSPGGYLYKVNLEDKAIPNMLDWDKPLSQQSQSVKDALEKSEYALRDMAYEITGKHDPTGGDIVRTSMKPEQMSEHLRSLGIPGIKYLDQSSRKNIPAIRKVNVDGKTKYEVNPGWSAPNKLKFFDTQEEAQNYADSFGTRNFVIFPGEEKNLKILERKKEGGSVNHKAVASARRALEKAMAKGGAVKMAGGGSMLGRAAKAGAKRSAKAGNKTTLPQEVLSQEETAENLRRFLDPSQVKDRLYHATPKDFKEFKPGGEDPTLSGPAIWLSTDPTNQPAMHNISAGRAGEFREGTNVMPVYAQAKNPLVLDDPVMIDWAQAVFAGGSREFPELIAPKWAEEIRKEGYDSILFLDPRRTGQTHEVIMFEPNKIKSAIGNRGTFDTREADITKRKGGLAALRK